MSIHHIDVAEFEARRNLRDTLTIYCQDGHFGIGEYGHITCIVRFDRHRKNFRVRELNYLTSEWLIDGVPVTESELRIYIAA